VARVVGAAEEALLLELVEPRLDRRARLLELRDDRVVLRRQLLQGVEVVEVRLQCSEQFELAPRRGVLGRHLRRALLVVPEARLLHLLLERRYALLEGGWVKGSPRAA